MLYKACKGIHASAHLGEHLLCTVRSHHHAIRMPQHPRLYNTYGCSQCKGQETTGRIPLWSMASGFSAQYCK
jgi:hypothetical protein